MPFNPPFAPSPVDFPNLQATGFKQTSPQDARYNCFAWAMGEQRMLWDPTSPKDSWWPLGVPRSLSLFAFHAAFATRGYQPCADGNPEGGFEKISISTLNGVVKHAARQLRDGSWTSKLGKNADIGHTLDGLDGPFYGDVVSFMKRPMPPIP
jgi:hypothetical protein